MKKVLIFDDNSKVIENQLKTIETNTFSTFVAEPNSANILDKKPGLIVVNQNMIKNGLKEIFSRSNSVPVILITDNGPEKQSFEAWSSPVHVVKNGDWDQFKITVKEVLNFFD